MLKLGLLRTDAAIAPRLSLATTLILPNHAGITMENRSYSGLITAALVAAVVALIVALIFRGGAGTGPDTSKQFAEVERAGEIRAAYAVGDNPVDVHDDPEYDKLRS